MLLTWSAMHAVGFTLWSGLGNDFGASLGLSSTPVDDRAWQARARRQRYVAYAMAGAIGVIGFLMSTKPELW